MTIRADEHFACKGGCGKPVMNRTGLCAKCRKINCNRCGKEFSIKTLGVERCGHCKFSVAQTARGSAAI